MRSHTAYYTCPIVLELLAGARDSERADLDLCFKHANRIVVTPSHWDQAGKMKGTLRTRGIKVPAADALIAMVTYEARMPILVNDKHFQMMRDELLPDLELTTPY